MPGGRTGAANIRNTSYDLIIQILFTQCIDTTINILREERHGFCTEQIQFTAVNRGLTILSIIIIEIVGTGFDGVLSTANQFYGRIVGKEQCHGLVCVLRRIAALVQIDHVVHLLFSCLRLFEGGSADFTVVRSRVDRPVGVCRIDIYPCLIHFHNRLHCLTLISTDNRFLTDIINLYKLYIINFVGFIALGICHLCEIGT